MKSFLVAIAINVIGIQLTTAFATNNEIIPGTITHKESVMQKCENSFRLTLKNAYERQRITIVKSSVKEYKETTVVVLTIKNSDTSSLVEYTCRF